MIIRREHRRNYTTIANELINDDRLSYEVLGLLLFLLSLPDDWEIHVNQLRRRGRIGRPRMYRILNQLQQAGYLRHDRIRDQRGVLTGGYWIVCEDPALAPPIGKKKNSSAEENRQPRPENPDVVIATSVNPTLRETHNHENPQCGESGRVLKTNYLPKTHQDQATFSLRENVRPRDESRILAEQAVAIYNAVAIECGWPQAQRLTDRRKAALNARLREAAGLVGWQAAMDKARASPFLRGETGRSPDHENWRPDLDFFVRASVFTKLMEGGYDRTNHRPRGRSGAHDPLFAALAKSIADGPRGGERQAAPDERGSADATPALPDRGVHR
jgi:hypothetical protein